MTIRDHCAMRHRPCVSCCCCIACPNQGIRCCCRHHQVKDYCSICYSPELVRQHQLQQIDMPTARAVTKHITQQLIHMSTSKHMCCCCKQTLPHQSPLHHETQLQHVTLLLHYLSKQCTRCKYWYISLTAPDANSSEQSIDHQLQHH